MLSRVFNLCYALPITCLILFVAGALWAADNTLARQLGISYPDAQVLLGAQTPLSLWDGHWWTIFITGFHHGDIIHLLMNCSALFWLGRLLETRMGSWRYALFSAVALVISIMTQSLWSPCVGLSGMLFAQFGLMWAWRRTDSWLQTYVSDDQIYWCLFGLFFCVALTWMRLMAIGNAAHFSGIIYGYLTGLTYFGGPRARTWKPVLRVAHFILIPWFYLLLHPVWNGEYHWRRGDLAKDPYERLQHYENALKCNPELQGPWLNISLILGQEDQTFEAWEWILRGIRQHPSYEDAIKQAHRLWGQFGNRLERNRARQKLREIFGDQAPAWEEKLLAGQPFDEQPVRRKPAAVAKAPGDEDQIEAPEVEFKPFSLPLRTLEDVLDPTRKLPAVPNPNDPHSAAEGESV